MSKQKKHLIKIGIFFWLTNILLLIIVVLFGHQVKGARRWISLFGFNFQPSEFIKIGIILQSSHYINSNLYIYFLTYFIPIILIFLQPDLGTVLLLTCLASAQIISKSEKINFKLIVASFLSVISIIGISYLLLPHVSQRINMFFNSNKDIYGTGYQRHKAFLAIAKGGIMGKGFGKGEIKDLLPDAHTDYVFAVISEEFGIIGSLFVVLIFVLLGLRCRILTGKNDFFSMVQYSSILIILGQAWLNIASTLSLIPSKGITMPLISYGGSGIVSQGFIFGILLASSIKKSKVKQSSN